MRNLYTVEKRFDVLGPCCFRQWRAPSHCSFLHGYGLSFVYRFSAVELNSINWVVDFGGLGKLKDRLELMFDHTTVIASDDPALPHFRELDKMAVIDLRIVDNIGCERFAQLAYDYGQDYLVTNELDDRVRLDSVRVEENGKNSATYQRT